jgi:hypothetical protein
VNLTVTGKVIRRAALFMPCLGIVMALFILPNRERQPWSQMEVIGTNGQRVSSVWVGQSGNQKFARLLRALPALAKARMADSKLMTPFQVHAASASPCTTVKASMMKVAQSTPSSVAPDGNICFMCFAQVVEMPCLGCDPQSDYLEFFNTGLDNCHGVEFPNGSFCDGCEEFQTGCYNTGCDDC